MAPGSSAAETPGVHAPASKMLLDSPATNPALGFGDVARAFTSIIETSEPRFAIGIFGDWGSGKTTLMDAIEAGLSRDKAIAVRFNAWRFERERELLVPLLDTIRQGLVEWADERPQSQQGARAREAAHRIGRVVRALLSGVSVEVGIPATAKVSYDVGAALDQLSAGDEQGEQPQSLYFAGFRELSEALGEFAKEGVTRIVVFVDDLDRCLPVNALDVLEAMKLFFDLPGFVFVVGLDEEIVERAVRGRFADLVAVQRADAVTAHLDGEHSRIRVGGEYVKKLFQVPYALPPMLAEQLDDLLAAMYREAALGPEQLADLDSRVRRYLGYVARDGRINPREVKRYINAYTLQTLIRPELDRDVVLALQTIAFRADWEVAYDAVLTDSALFSEAVRSYREGDERALQDIWPRGSVVPSEFAAYARSPELEPLVRAYTLEPYLFSLQSTRSVHRWLIEAYAALGGIRRGVREVRGIVRTGDAEANRLSSEIAEHSERLANSLTSVAESTTGAGLTAQLGALQQRTSELGTTEGSLDTIADAMDETVARLQDELRIIRRRSVLEPQG